jgi:hypothetical protein
MEAWSSNPSSKNIYIQKQNHTKKTGENGILIKERKKLFLLVLVFVFGFMFGRLVL